MSVVFPWISTPHGSLGLAHHRYAYCLWELSDANTHTLSGPLTLIRSVWCLEGQMVVVAIRAPGLTPLPIAGWLALGYEAWDQAMHICVSKLPIIDSDNGLSPGRRQAIIRTNDGILLTRPLGTNFSEILSEIHTFSFKKMRLKMSSGKWRPFCLGLNVLIKKCVKFFEKIHILEFGKTWNFYHMCP